MYRILALAAATALVTGCDPCTGYDGTTIVDDEGALSEAEHESLQATVTDFLDWTGSNRVCVDRVIVKELRDTHIQIDRLSVGRRDIDIDPDSEDLVLDLRWGLCAALYDAEDLEADASDFIDDASDFASYCRYGPPDWWASQSESACGEPGLSVLDAYLLDRVYPEYPGPRLDGTLHAAWMEEIRVADVWPEEEMWVDLEPVGDQLALMSGTSTSEETQEAVVELVDLETGEKTELLRLSTAEDTITSMVGGSGLVVVVEDYAADTMALYVLNPDTLEMPLLEFGNLPQVDFMQVSDGRLIASEFSFHQAPLWAIDLGTGEIELIDLPTLDSPLESLVNGGPVPAPGGFVVSISEAEVEEDYDVVSITSHRFPLERYDFSTGTWSELLDDLWTGPAGTTSTGLVVGTLYNRSGPDLLGAYDLEGDRLLVSDDFCIGEGDYPRMMVGDRLMEYETEGTDLILRPIEVVSGG